MNSDNGALDFDVYFNNKAFNKAVDESEKRVKGFSSAVVAEGEKIDDAFKITAENIRIQKDVIAKLEGEIGNLNIEISKLPKGSIGQTELKKQAAQLTAELNAEKTALKQLESEVKQTEVAHKSFRTQVREAREELIRMEQAGLRGTDAYNVVQQRLGELTDAMGDAQAQAHVLANDERGFQGVVSALSGFTGAMSAAQGAVGLFAGENENLNKIMLKVQSLMAITIGLQQVAQTLNKDSYFRIVMLTKAKEMWAVANLKVATTLGISTAAAQVLMATLTLGLSIAITGLIVLLSKMSSESSKAREQMKAFNESVAENASKTITVLAQLSTGWDNLGNNMKDKQKFVDQNAEKFKELGVSVTTVNEAEKLLVENKDKFIEALIQRAKALAATEIASQKYKEALLKQMELEKTPKTKTETITSPETGAVLSSYEVDNRKYSKLENEKNKLEKEGDDLFKKASEFTQKEQDILKGLGVANNEIVEGSIAALEASIQKLQDKYNKAGSDKERNKILKELNAQKALRDKIDKSDDKAPDPKKEEDKILRQWEKDLKRQLELADSVLEKMNIIKQKKDEIQGDTSNVGKGKADILSDAEFDVGKEAKDKTKQLLDDYGSYLSNKVKMQKEYNDDMLVLYKALENETDPEKQNQIQGALSNRRAKFRKDSKLSGDANYDELLVNYRSFEQKKEAINEDYNEKRRKAIEMGDVELIKRLNEAQAKELSSLATDELMKSPDWTKLFADLDNVSTKELEKLVKKVEDNQANLGVKLDPADLDSINQKVDEAKKEIESRNPFKALVNGIKEYSNATSEEDKKKSFKKMFEGAAASITLVKGAFDSVVGGLDKMGISMDENTKAILDDIGGIAQGANELATGIATGDPLAIVKGAIGVISNGVDLIFGSKDRKLEKEIQRHKEAVEALSEAYKDLERAVDKALGGDVYKNQQQMIRNLQKQRQEYLAMIQAEEDKKKTDGDKIKEYQNAYKEAGQTIEDILEQIAQDILQTNAKDFANQFGDAIVEAFGKGEDAAKSFGGTVNDIMKNAVLNQLKKNFLEKQLQGALNDLEKSMGYWQGDEFVFDGLSAEEQARFKDKVAAIGRNFSSALDVYGDLFKDFAEDKNSMKGQIKGVSEETASLIGGQTNAIRINQMESLNIMRNQLIALNKIEANTALQVMKLIEIINLMRSNQTDPLRGQGLA